MTEFPTAFAPASRSTLQDAHHTLTDHVRNDAPKSAGGSKSDTIGKAATFRKPLLGGAEAPSEFKSVTPATPEQIKKLAETHQKAVAAAIKSKTKPAFTFGFHWKSRAQQHDDAALKAAGPLMEAVSARLTGRSESAHNAAYAALPAMLSKFEAFPKIDSDEYLQLARDASHIGAVKDIKLPVEPKSNNESDKPITRADQPTVTPEKKTQWGAILGTGAAGLAAGAGALGTVAYVESNKSDKQIKALKGQLQDAQSGAAASSPDAAPAQ